MKRTATGEHVGINFTFIKYTIMFGKNANSTCKEERKGVRGRKEGGRKIQEKLAVLGILEATDCFKI